MFTFSQFKLAESFEDKYEFKWWKIRFHVVLGKSKEEAWSLVKIIRVISIVLHVLFEELMQNIRYFVLRSNNVAFEFTIIDFLLMNLNNLSTVLKILCNVDTWQVVEENRNALVIGYAHIKAFYWLLLWLLGSNKYWSCHGSQ